jgi:hypothetical protein
MKKTYKYLRTKESEGIHHQQMKERLQMEYTRKLRMILKPVLNAKDDTTAIAVLAILVLRCSFRIINRRLEETTNTARKTTRKV